MKDRKPAKYSSEAERRTAQRAYYAANRERIRAEQKRYSEKNKILIAQRSRRARATNRDRIAEQAKRSYQKNKHKYRRRQKNTAFLRRYGITVEQFEQMAAAQVGRCYICGIEPAIGSLHVDHCHKSNKVRKLLCGSCNRGIGFFFDDADRLMRAAAYIKDHQS